MKETAFEAFGKALSRAGVGIAFRNRISGNTGPRVDPIHTPGITPQLFAFAGWVQMLIALKLNLISLKKFWTKSSRNDKTGNMGSLG